MRGIEAQIDRFGALHAAHEQAGGDEEDERDGDLRHHEDAPRTLASTAI